MIKDVVDKNEHELVEDHPGHYDDVSVQILFNSNKELLELWNFSNEFCYFILLRLYNLYKKFIDKKMQYYN